MHDGVFKLLCKLEEYLSASTPKLWFHQLHHYGIGILIGITVLLEKIIYRVHQELNVLTKLYNDGSWNKRRPLIFLFFLFKSHWHCQLCHSKALPHQK